MNQEAFERGLHHGWDAANFAAAYGHDETPEQEATRRAGEYTAVNPSFDAIAYREGFAVGYVRFGAGQWQDGTPRDTEEGH